MTLPNHYVHIHSRRLPSIKTPKETVQTLSGFAPRPAVTCETAVFPLCLWLGLFFSLSILEHPLILFLLSSSLRRSKEDFSSSVISQTLDNNVFGTFTIASPFGPPVDFSQAIYRDKHGNPLEIEAGELCQDLWVGQYALR